MVAIAGAIATVAAAAIGAGASLYANKKSTEAANQAQQRQQEYYNQLAANEAATKAEEDRITRESLERNRAYGASLLDNGTALKNMLSGGYNEGVLDDENKSVLSSTLGSGSVSSMFA